MGIQLEIDMGIFDGGSISGDEVEAGGSVAQPGWYRCVVDTVEHGKDDEYQLKVAFKITHGPYKGQRIYDTLFLPGRSNEPDKDRKSAQRIALYAKRLGVWSGEATESLSFDTDEWVGREVVIDARSNKYKNKDGIEVQNIKPDWAGIYPLTDARIPDTARKSLGLAGTSSAAATTIAKPAATTIAKPAKPAARKPVAASTSYEDI